ncbi:F-box/kelch-repeat protein At1g57790-like [Papaver somniferum]|uniref:F-box/kelch-repeat protein At1g57790-like n=1 Tax=Papaver somniferum TaxID=3469 RepID=UPI000E7007B0|nr:F-box/kelch-repeat protein At1g57790-like [Papaver somniferum]
MEVTEVNTFGDHVLFLSNTTSFGCSAAELGLSKGCLYYALDEDQSLHKFEVESNGNSIILPCLNIPTPWYTSSWIMVHDNKHHRKENMFGKDEELKAILDNKTSRTGNDKNKGEREESHNRGQHQEAAIPWDILNRDMVGLIAKNYLHRLDYIHFRLVSKVNLAVMPMVKQTSPCTTRCTDLSPWFVFSRDKCHNVFNFVNPTHNDENYLMHLSDLVGATIRFQKGGWLLMSKGLTSIFFYNPFTKESINLPELPVDMYSFSGITFSCSPTSSDCIVFAVQQIPASDGMSQEISICFIKRGAVSWSVCNSQNTNVEKFMPSHNTPVFYNGAFYCVDYNGMLGVFNLEDHSWKVLEKPLEQFSGIYPSFLVECAGQILLVNFGHLGATIRVFRLDFSKMVWDEVRNLGKHMLFISYTSCFSAIAPHKRMENKIYFPRLCLNGEGVLFYSLETGNYHSFGTRHSANNFYETEGWYTNCTWIEPNWSKAQELDWLKPLL